MRDRRDFFIHRQCNRPCTRLGAACFASAVVILALVSGCADLTYDRVRIGSPRSEYDRILVADESRWTDAGLVQYSERASGRVDALVLLLSNDRRIAGKIQATRVEREFGPQHESGYRLRGTIDRAIYGLAETGPVDILRLLTHTLTDARGERRAVAAQHLIAAGVIQILRAQPNAADPGVSAETVADIALHAPDGGSARLSLDPSGLLQFSYEQGASP